MYYLIVWCEDSQQWWQADECQERTLGRPRRCSTVATRGGASGDGPGRWLPRTTSKRP